MNFIKFKFFIISNLILSIVVIILAWLFATEVWLSFLLSSLAVLVFMANICGKDGFLLKILSQKTVIVITFIYAFIITFLPSFANFNQKSSLVWLIYIPAMLHFAILFFTKVDDLQ